MKAWSASPSPLKSMLKSNYLKTFDNFNAIREKIVVAIIIESGSAKR